MQVSGESVQTSGSGPDKMEFGDKGIVNECKSCDRFLSVSAVHESGSREQRNWLTADFRFSVEMPVSYS